jgi:hypothetical protein
MVPRDCNDHFFYFAFNFTYKKFFYVIECIVCNDDVINSLTILLTPNDCWQTYLQFRVRCIVLFWHLYCFYFVQVLHKKDLLYFIIRLQQCDVCSIPLDKSYFTTSPLRWASLFELTNGKKTKRISARQSNSVSRWTTSYFENCSIISIFT